MQKKILKKIIDFGKAIAKHPIETSLVLTLGFAISCESVQNNTAGSISTADKACKIYNESGQKSPPDINQVLSAADGEYILVRTTATTKKQQEILDNLPGLIKGSYVPKYHTTAHRFIDIERDFGATAEDYQTLDTLIDKALAKIQVKQDYTKMESVQILKNIASVFSDFNTVENNLFSTGLKEKTFDCDNYCITYLAVGEVLHLPITMVNVFNHTFIRWSHKKEHFNWDVTLTDRDNKMVSDEEYQGIFGKNTKFIEMGEKELIAISYFNRGFQLFGQDKNEQSIPEYDIALKLFPHFTLAVLDKGLAQFRIKEYECALMSFNRFIAYHPDYPDGYNGRGIIYNAKGEYARAIDEFTEAIKADPKFYLAYENRAASWKKLGNEKNAAEDFKKAVDILFPPSENPGLLPLKE